MALPSKLQDLVENKIISTEQAEQIVAYEQNKKNSFAWRTMFLIAGILIGLGFISIVSSNWRIIPDIAKLVGNYSIFAAIIYGIYWSLNKNKKYLKELFITLAFFMIGESIGLNGIIFNLDGGWQAFAIFWAILSLPFILFSQMTYINTIWILLIISGLQFSWLEKFWHETNYPLFFISLAILILGGISNLSMKLYNYTKHKIILPKSIALFSNLLMYILILFGDSIFLSFNITANKANLTFIGMHIIVFAFLGIRMALAHYNKDTSSFKNNTLLAELYIFYLFLKQIDDLLLSGVGFMATGILLLVLMYSLKKTSDYIKGMVTINEK